MSDTRIQIVHGRVMDPLNATVDDINIKDIAHALSNQCRFAGHVKKFYSVAEHSIRVSKIVPEEDALWALLHDASEAYLVDVPSPLKNALFGEAYRKAEDKLMQVICAKYGLVPKMPDSVKYADNALLATEVRDLLHPVSSQKLKDDLWMQWFFADPTDDVIETPLTPDEARIAFMVRFHVLTDNI